MPSIADHPQRFALVNELHARPFPSVEAPSHAVFLAFKEPVDAANRDRARDRDHLVDLVGRHGAPEPQPGATHYSGQLGRHLLKWESHTEFVTYSAFAPGLADRPFDPAKATVFAEDWQAAAPGKRLCAVLVRVELMPEHPGIITQKLEDWFVAESLACARVLDGAAVVAGDFRIDPAGFMRFAVFVEPGTSPRRIGRIVQRLSEIETYRAMSMLGLGRARDLGGRLNRLEAELGALVEAMDDGAQPAEATLHALLRISAELETLASRFSFRAGATAAYEAIVNDRITVLREERFMGRQTFAEFMRRRYDPAMRTVKSAETRLRQMVDRATRAAELLRTRVDVERSAQNQKLLESMDKRADLQLRLQRTVEGLSVVAISYYAVSLVGYLVAPLAEPAGLSKTAMMAMITLPVVALVWAMVRRIRQAMH
jgi:uncharacterized membrane-anchored protein